MGYSPRVAKSQIQLSDCACTHTGIVRGQLRTRTRHPVRINVRDAAFRQHLVGEEAEERLVLPVHPKEPPQVVAGVQFVKK